uniref:GDP-fucose pyrophosphorylase domain-containing protein n=1 Tax=Ciona savignyi TaxID=51511 RepID=H2YSE9_CIOSA
IAKVNAETRERFQDFDALRGKHASAGEFWDLVVITAADHKQREAYEVQISSKLKANELPTSAEYVVVEDPPGYKIGNGGSTMVVLEVLYEKYGENLYDKKCIIIHAGGYSQRLLIASVLGKVFTSVPLNEPLYQLLELKLASYIDFPRKIERGGVFVYNTKRFFIGVTGLAHPSSVTIGTTHGVYLLNHDAPVDTLIRSCKKFLHKPSAERMHATDGCVIRNGAEELVLTDSAFFMAPDVCEKLRKFYTSHKPLTCEIDAYGDFMQALGSKSDDQYITNSANVVFETDSLVALRQEVFQLMRDTPLQVVCLASFNDVPDSDKITSHFYHFGTTAEYIEILTKDSGFLDLVGSDGLAYCADQTAKRSMYSIAASVIYSIMQVGDGSVIEYCKFKENVSIGANCILSNCILKPNTTLPDGILLHTVAICSPDTDSANKSIKYVTVLFSVLDCMKSAVPISSAANLTYLGKPLENWFKNPDQAFSDVQSTKASLWNAKLFTVCDSMEESAHHSINMLKQLNQNWERGEKLKLDEGLLSMSDALRLKNVNAMLSFRLGIFKEIEMTRTQNSVASA